MIYFSKKSPFGRAFKKFISGGACVAQSVKRPTWAQVMISQFVGLSPTSKSVLTAQGLEPAVSPSLSVPAPLALCLSKINIKFFFKLISSFIPLLKVLLVVFLLVEVLDAFSVS